MNSPKVIKLNGADLSCDTMHIIMHESVHLHVGYKAMDRVKSSFDFVQQSVANNDVIYGITTGFGSLRDRVISSEDTSELQTNLIKSHAVGTGNPIPVPMVRGMLALRINSLIKGYSGVSQYLIKYLVEAFNKGVVGKVPEQGSVGASGDLAPLSHLVVGYLGEGELYDPKEERYDSALDVLSRYDMVTLSLGPKEGLALNNGTTFMTTHLSEAVYQSTHLLSNANIVAALTLDALHGTHKAFHPKISEARPHAGQASVSKSMRQYLSDSESHDTHAANVVQDAYSLRCIPQVHGAVQDTLTFVEKIVTTELNSATDNPLIVCDEDGYKAVSGGNFHGMPVALCADYLGIALTTLGNISERRIERLVNSNLSKLPSFLVDQSVEPGLHSGYMIIQYTAAALAAENRQLSNPSSVHTIPTCENQEDHVSMGPWGCRKVLQILNNTQKIVALELMCAVQAKEFTPEPTTDILESVITKVRQAVPRMMKDIYLHPHMEAVIDLVKSGTLV